jgi:hypothetical protein
MAALRTTPLGKTSLQPGTIIKLQLGTMSPQPTSVQVHTGKHAEPNTVSAWKNGKH